MDPARRRELARRGGQAAHAGGQAHRFDHREAVEAGRKGGRVVSRDRQHMAEIGRRGGRATHQREDGQGPAEAGGHA
jgi:general stress protein YciG